MLQLPLKCEFPIGFAENQRKFFTIEDVQLLRRVNDSAHIIIIISTSNSIRNAYRLNIIFIDHLMLNVLRATRTNFALTLLLSCRSETHNKKEKKKPENISINFANV